MENNNKDILANLTKLTNLTTQNIKNIENIISYCISDCIINNINNGEDITEINSSLGSLYIKLEKDIIKYKFIPSKEFEEIVKDTYKNKLNLLDVNLENVLSKKLTETYTSLF